MGNSPTEINFVKKLREGYFSEMWEGRIHDQGKGGKTVTVKIHKSHKMSQRNFLKMASLMKFLHHHRIISLCGVCTKEEPFYIITELLKQGTLLQYL